MLEVTIFFEFGFCHSHALYLYLNFIFIMYMEEKLYLIILGDLG